MYTRPVMRAWLAAFGFASVVAACGSTGPYVWVDSLPPQQAAGGADVVIADGDVINVRVFNQDPLSTREKVRSDGKISLPVVGEIAARGKRPAQLATEIQDKLKSVVVAPSVTVSVEQNAELKVSVVGEVKQSGVFPLEPGATVLHALAAGGGLSDYADRDKIFVVRKSLPQRVRFRYSDLRSQEAHAIGFALQPGDVVVVE